MEKGELKPSLQKRQKRRDKRMGEEVIECYRTGWRTKRAKGHLRQIRSNGYENVRSKEGMKVMHHGGTRSMSDDLEPLIRYLRSHVGKHWDKVYSDLCRMLHTNTVTGQHVIHHLKQFVIEKVVKENGEWIAYDEGAPRVIGKYYWRDQFFVHPKSGVLMEYKPRKKMR